MSIVARPSYGSLARDMLTGLLDGGVLPWEIFLSDVLALPGQRSEWSVPFFPHACATELVLRAPVYKLLSGRKLARKSPNRLVIGVESSNSLTKSQVLEWLRGLGISPQPGVVFNFLPMDLMLRAMGADAIDGFVAPSPWGLIAEEKKLGILDRRFTPGTYAQQIVFACRKSRLPAGCQAMRELAQALTAARTRLADSARFASASHRMALSGKPVIPFESLAHAMRYHQPLEAVADVPSDEEKITLELLRLESFQTLPPQVAPNGQTVGMLLPG